MLSGLLSALAAGCSAIPAAGPTSSQIENATTVGPESTSPSDKDYVVVDVNNDVVRALQRYHATGLREFASSKVSFPKPRIGVGDTLAITIWEAGEGGLFSSASNKSVTLPSVVVDRSGSISLPYAGAIKVQNATPVQVQERIIEGLKDRAIQPQAIVSITRNESNTAILNGEVTKPGRYPLSLQGTRLLDVLAEAGGSKTPPSETYITFLRGNQRATQLLQSVVDSETENVWIQAGDQVYLSHEPRRFSVFGAVEKPGVYPFGTTHVNLLEGVAASGGLIDEKADGTGLFVFRHERREVVEGIVPGLNRPIPDDYYVPVVYRVNLREPAAYFYAKGVALRDKDVIYVANARSVEIAKVLSLLNLGTRTVGNVLPRSIVGN